MKRDVVWITGAGGLIGNYLVQAAPTSAPTFEIVGLTRAQLDLLDFDAVRGRFFRQPPTLLIHCAAMSHSPQCQENPELARKVNVEMTALLAELAAGIPFIFFSSDLVFDGLQGNYDEKAPVRALSVYAQTKVDAEQIVLANSKHTVVRTSLNLGRSPKGDKGFNEQLLKAWELGKMPTLFTDEFRCPIPAPVTARAIWELAQRNRPGLYHLAGSERMSRWQIGQLLAARWPQLHPKIIPGSVADFQGAPRSPDTSLNCAKLQQLLSFRLPGLPEWLAENPNEKV